MARIISILVTCLLLSVPATNSLAQGTGDPAKPSEQVDKAPTQGGTSLQIAESAPDRYLVKSGDTLWGIAKRYLADPWRWPELWRGNREQVSDPHLIYPGWILVLDRARGALRVERADAAASSAVRDDERKDDKSTRMQPVERIENIEKPIPIIPAHVIAPYLSRPLVIEASTAGAASLRDAPTLAASVDGRVILGVADRGFVTGIKSDQLLWHVFRPGKQLKDPDTQELLGTEAVFLGTVKVLKRGEPSEVQVISSKQEMLRGDRLVPAERQPIANFVLKRPDREISAKVIGIYGGVDSAGQYSIVTINKGRRDGLEHGNVLALFRTLRPITITNEQGKPVPLAVPDDRFGLATIFRVNERVSYALVMEATGPLKIGDALRNP